MIYAQNLPGCHYNLCLRLKVRENIIVLHEQGEMNGDIEQIGAFRKKFYQAYVILITDRLTPEASKVYLNSGIKRYRQFEHHHRPVKAENRHHQ